MKNILMGLVFTSMFFLSACNSSSSDAVAAPANVEVQAPSLDYRSAPITLNNTNAQFASDVKYGADPLQAFDLFLPDAISATSQFPLVIYIHGGSFDSGEKETVYSDINLDGDNAGDKKYGYSIYAGDFSEQINTYLDNGVAFATLDYRLLASETIDTEGVIKPLSDMKRALQYIRYHASTFGIDKTKIVLHGLSAGAGGALWIGLNDDSAILNSTDPIERESTRVSGIVVQETQSTYDLVDWISIGAFRQYIPFSELVFKTVIDVIFIAQPILKDRILSFFSIESVDQLYSAETEAYRESIDFLNALTTDDPELWVSNVEEEAVIPSTQSLFFHHPAHAQIIRDKANAENLAGVFYIPALDVIDASGETLTDFVLRKLEVQ